MQTDKTSLRREPGASWTRRRLAPVVAAAAIGVAALAGCGSSSNTTSSNTTAGSSTTTASSSSSDSTTTSAGANPSAYLSAIKTQPHFQGLSDDNLTTLGNDVCQDFQQGNSLDQTENDAVQAVNEINANDAESGNNPGGNLDSHDAGFLIGAAVKGLCPQYSDQLPSS